MAIFRWLPVILISILLTVSLSLLNMVMNDSEYADRYGNLLIYLSIFILLLLSVAILVNLVRVIYQWHMRQAGSRFTLRLMAGFLVLTLLPVLVVSVFSMNIIGKNINQQVDGRVESALENALELARMSLSTRSRGHLQQLSLLGDRLNDKNRLEIAAIIDSWRTRSGAYEVILLSRSLDYVINSSDSLSALMPLFATEDLMRQMEDSQVLTKIETTEDDGIFSRVAIRVTYGIDNEKGVLTALFPFSENQAALSQNVASVWEDYQQISRGRGLLKQAFRVALAATIILSVLFSLWAAFIFSRRLTQPVRDLMEGTLAVASGDLQKKLPVSDRDDFSLLARSFNTMTKRLSNVQEERELARKQLQQEHDYLDVVLEHLSSGVVTLDDRMVIRRVNSAANRILNEPVQQQVGQPFVDVCQQVAALKPFLQALQPWLRQPDQDWQAEVSLSAEGRRKILMCRGAGLPVSAEHNQQQQGYVLVFEDVTDVVQAEHDAAWGEVARRLAHEIKNPLTPIQLSAERLSRKLGKVLEEDAASFLARMTGTIIQQVDALKAMVNAFSDYARAPALVIQAIDLNRIIADVTVLYHENPQQVILALELEQGLPPLQLDQHRIRQLLVNLIKNALEALGADEIAAGNEKKQLNIITRLVKVEDDKQAHYVLLSLQDNGPGIPENLLPQLFEPYVTSKRKGTGLGLAIVKKIVEEHGGTLSAGNLEPKGAMINIRFPVRHPVSGSETGRE
ncbi:MAG: PAS domain-containing sensor histidine kinase [Thiothrix nivea]|nr:MAG: PAS domain-containing sensor histidine kinase [Thiothrix nivea]